MQLWNDYEGKTLAGAFPIEALLFTEGRNASFATRDRAGRAAVLRLTEALNDQQEMRERYSAIQAASHRNLVRIEDFGDVEMEGTPLIYLVMETTDESLAGILADRPLSSDETSEVGLSLVAALEALHARQLVHGKVEPASVLAAGQIIKLRSDCIRTAPGGEEGSQARAADVFGLADVLNRCLTQRPLQEASDALALPEPYASIARNVVRGTWGLEQVAGELRRYVRPAISSQTVQVAAPEGPIPVVPASSGILETSVSGRKDVRAGTLTESQLPLVYATADQGNKADSAEPEVQPGASRLLPGAEQTTRSPLIWVAAAVALGVVLLLVWHFIATPRRGSVAATGVAVPTSAAAPAAPRVVDPAPLAPPPAPVGASASTASVPAGGQVWRVVSYTYNVEAQARARAHAIEVRHADLHPQVFSRTGHAPYLVTLGGALTRPQAAAVLQHARSERLARDLYMQNYSH